MAPTGVSSQAGPLGNAKAAVGNDARLHQDTERVATAPPPLHPPIRAAPGRGGLAGEGGALEAARGSSRCVRRPRRNPPGAAASGVRSGGGRAGESSPARLAHRRGSARASPEGRGGSGALPGLPSPAPWVPWPCFRRPPPLPPGASCPAATQGTGRECGPPHVWGAAAPWDPSGS